MSTGTEDLHALMDVWQNAMRRRDQLQNLRDGLNSIRGDLNLSTLQDVERLLAEADADVARAQAAVLGAAR